MHKNERFQVPSFRAIMSLAQTGRHFPVILATVHGPTSSSANGLILLETNHNLPQIILRKTKINALSFFKSTASLETNK